MNRTRFDGDEFTMEGSLWRSNRVSDQRSRVRWGAIRWLVRETLANLILIAMLFGAVGRWNWWMGWALAAVYIFWTASTAIIILPRHPEMLAERSLPHSDTRRWDMALIAAMAVFMVAEYDILLVWAMASNAFFVATVRIQKEREHKVVSGGPYRFVRHPGYLGMILLHWGVPLMLSSLWAFIPAFLYCITMVARTKLEDGTLLAELPGYKEYAERVRYRLLPVVW